MAVETETIERDEATPDSVARSVTDGDTVEVALPEHFEATVPKEPSPPSGGATVPEAAAPVPATPAPTPSPSSPPPSPVAPSPPVAATPTVKPHEPLSPAAKEERRKRKYYMGVAERVTAERDAALERLGVPVPRTEFRPDPKRGEALRKAADEASSVGIAAQLTVQEVTDQFREWQANFFNDLDGYLHRRELKRMELDFKSRHSDYNEKCAKAGVFEACQVGADGQWKNPAIARAVYFDESGQPRANPIEAGYTLAEEILRINEGKDEDDTPPTPTEPVTTPPATSVVRAETVVTPAATPPAQPAAAPAAETIADAERRGARQVAEQVAQTSNRQRGISLLRSAGNALPRVELNDDLRRHIDDWDRRDPIGCGKWLTANPKIADWWTGD